VPRRIVPDNSVLVAALFGEKLFLNDGEFDLGRRALPLVNAIIRGHVSAFAPEVDSEPVRNRSAV
jgi:hypothetical protein